MATKNITVSVILVNYNAGKLLLRAVKSAINLPGAEVIVVDNNSSDTSMADLEKVVKAADLITIYNQDNLGFGKAVNQAAKHASGKYLYLLNPDAELTKSALSRMLETSAKYQDRAIIAPRLENPDRSPQPSCFRPQTIRNAVKEYWLGVKGAYEKYLPRGKKNPTPVHIAVAAAWLVPIGVWRELAGFDDKFFLYFEDLDMCDRAHRAGYQVIYDPGAVVKHAHGVSSRTNPVTTKLFMDSALSYHGRLKKIIIDFIILTRNLLTPPASTKKVITLLLAWVVVVLALATLSYFLLPARYQPLSFLPDFYRGNFLLWSWANFDGEHYLRIARDGYQVIAGQSQYAFFPLFPLLIKLVSLTGLDLYTSAHLIVAFSLIAFAYALVAWAKPYLKNPLLLLALFLLSPGAVFLLAIYSEPLFLLLTILTFLFADRSQWGRAILAAAFATATRVNGVFLVVFLFLKMRNRRLTSLLSLSGLIAYMSYLYITTGNALTFYTAQGDWGKSTPTYPWDTLVSYFRALTFEFNGDLTHLVVAIEVLVTLTVIFLMIKFWQLKSIDLAYKWHALLMLLLPLATGSLGSMPRFSLTLFPLLLVVASSPRRTIRYFLISGLFFIIGIILFVRGYWYA